MIVVGWGGLKSEGFVDDAVDCIFSSFIARLIPCKVSLCCCGEIGCFLSGIFEGGGISVWSLCFGCGSGFLSYLVVPGWCFSWCILFIVMCVAFVMQSRQ